MLPIRKKRRTIEGARAVAVLAEIRASVLALNDEDLLDLADIFGGAAAGPLKDIALVEMTNRKLSL